MTEYHQHADLSLLGELRKLDGPGFEGFVALDKTVGRTDGTIPPKYRELIALGVALTTQCPYCLDVHTANAKKAGATREELAETRPHCSRIARGRGAHARAARPQALR